MQAELEKIIGEEWLCMQSELEKIIGKELLHMQIQEFSQIKLTWQGRSCQKAFEQR